MRALALLAVCGCYGVDDIEGTWQPIETIGGVLAPEIGPVPMARVAPVGNIVRIATWNAYRAPDPELLAREYFASPALSRADVLLVQEVEAHDHEPTTRARRMAEALGMTWVFAPARDEGYRHGISIMSRYPITNARVMYLPLDEVAFNENPRNALAAEIVIGDKTLTVVDIHLDVRMGPVDRIKQMHPAVMQVPETVAIGGDFNTNPWAWVGSTVPLTSTQAIVGQDQAAIIDDYMAALGYASSIPPTASTFNKPLLDNMRLDNVYVRGHAVVGTGIATDVDGSDHWPVWIDLALQ